MEGAWVSLRAGGPEAYAVTPPPASLRGAVVVAMEIFGITAHVREACERLARETPETWRAPGRSTSGSWARRITW